MRLTDQQWALVQPLIPPPKSAALRGRPPIDERRILDAILWKLSTNSAWYDLPAEYPSHQSCYRRYRQWRKSGLVNSILSVLLRDLFTRGGFDPKRALVEGALLYRSKAGRSQLSINPDLEKTWQLSTASILVGLLNKKLKKFPAANLRL